MFNWNRNCFIYYGQDILFDIVASAKIKEGYYYVEPSDLEQIQMMRQGADERYSYDKDNFKTKGTLLVKIKDNQIKEHYELKEDILKKLESLSKSAK